MKEHIWRRVLKVAQYLLDSQATVREAAKAFGISKSTVHKDVTERLPQLNPALAKQVKEVLDLNKAERHIRGGEATRRKYHGRGSSVEA
jgi:putative DeoR family transcriptional regulator, stage III sporulation protein D